MVKNIMPALTGLTEMLWRRTENELISENVKIEYGMGIGINCMDVV